MWLLFCYRVFCVLWSYDRFGTSNCRYNVLCVVFVRNFVGPRVLSFIRTRLSKHAIKACLPVYKTLTRYVPCVVWAVPVLGAPLFETARCVLWFLKKYLPSYATYSCAQPPKLPAYLRPCVWDY